MFVAAQYLRRFSTRRRITGFAHRISHFKRKSNHASVKIRMDVHWVQKLAYLLMEDHTSSILAQIVHLIVISTIAVSIAAFTLETVPELWDTFDPRLWSYVDVVCGSVFTIEYGLRFWTCTVANTRRWVFFWSPLNLMDLSALIPFYFDLAMELVQSFGGSGSAQVLRVLRVFRLVRIIRVLKVLRHSSGLQVMFLSVKSSSYALVVLVFSFVLGVVTFSSAIHYIEKLGCVILEDVPVAEQEHIFMHMKQGTCENIPLVGWSRFGLCCDEYGSPLDFPSIPQAFWWSVVSMTTVGYGDKVPRTMPGKLVATVVILSGILFIALPTAIVGRKFSEIYTEVHDENSKCSAARSNSPSALYRKTQQSSTLCVGSLLEKRFVDKHMEMLVKNFCMNMSNYEEIIKDECRIREATLARSEEALHQMHAMLSKPQHRHARRSSSEEFRECPLLLCP